MKPSIEKLQKFFRLEAGRDYDNKAVMGGLASMLESWEAEARNDQLPEDIIQAVLSRLRDYHRLSPDSRKVALKGLWTRVRKQTGEGDTQILDEDGSKPASRQAQTSTRKEKSPKKEKSSEEKTIGNEKKGVKEETAKASKAKPKRRRRKKTRPPP